VKAAEACHAYFPISVSHLNVLDLFSGIGGMALGLQRAGMRPVAFCETDPFARTVLARHWPGRPCYPDIRQLTAAQLRSDGVPAPGLLCGGFPCQDVSAAGRGAGLDGERSGLWFEMLRLVEECRPGWVVVENVPALRVRGADRVLAGLEAAGYACWPLVVGAAHAGAPHRRARVFVVAHAGRAGLEGRLGGPAHEAPGLPVERRGGWPAEPRLRRVADGLSTRLDRPRIAALGNAVVPGVAEMIGRAIYAAADFTRSANTLRNLATFGATTARQYPAPGLRS
jgi:DNA (cytosine-5)-methyltransferase 1